jgi:hypothetical protein
VKEDPSPSPEKLLCATNSIKVQKPCQSLIRNTKKVSLIGSLEARVAMKGKRKDPKVVFFVPSSLVVAVLSAGLAILTTALHSSALAILMTILAFITVIVVAFLVNNIPRFSSKH